MPLVNTVRTPLLMGDVDAILAQAFENGTGRSIGKARPYLLSMIALENRNGQAIYNNNWGNVITTSSTDNYFALPNIPLKFKSISSQYNGATNFIKTLLSKTNSRILDASYKDDFDGFFQSIHDRHPTTHKAYNLVTDPTERSNLRNTYSLLVNKFKNSPVIEVRPKKKVIRKRTSSAGPSLLFIVLASAVGTYIYKKKQLKHG